MEVPGRRGVAIAEGEGDRSRVVFVAPQRTSLQEGNLIGLEYAHSFRKPGSPENWQWHDGRTALLSHVRSSLNLSRPFLPDWFCL